MRKQKSNSPCVEVEVRCGTWMLCRCSLTLAASSLDILLSGDWLEVVLLASFSLESSRVNCNIHTCQFSTWHNDNLVPGYGTHMEYM